jgi:hypothetical protein
MKAVAEFRYCCLGNIFMEPREYHEIPLHKKLYFGRSMGLLVKRADGDAQYIRKWGMGCLVHPPHSY